VKKPVYIGKKPSTPISKEKVEVYSQTNGRQECADPIEGVGVAHTEETNSFELVWIVQIYAFVRSEICRTNASWSSFDRIGLET
jgi:hypothetical protein